MRLVRFVADGATPMIGRVDEGRSVPVQGAVTVSVPLTPRLSCPGREQNVV